jgi:hypothetical protein
MTTSSLPTSLRASLYDIFARRCKVSPPRFGNPPSILLIDLKSQGRVGELARYLRKVREPFETLRIKLAGLYNGFGYHQQRRKRLGGRK